MGIDLGVNQNK